jgi:long-chain acyl-CoA synthetase
VSVDADELRQHAADRLAYFELPTRWWLRREPLPTNATGKVVKRALRDAWPDDGRPTTGGPIG